MSLWVAALLGIVEGLTEFLPVSSTGHLILTARLAGLEEGPRSEVFEIFIQLGAVLAAGVEYHRRLMTAAMGLYFGHGIDHSEKVALEAGALAYIEGERLFLKDPLRREACLLAQIAGLLHDVRRNEKDHAQAGASAASRILREYLIFPKERDDIMQAIANR